MSLFELCFVFALVTTQQDLVLTQRWWGNSAPTKAPVAQPKTPAPAKTHTFDLGKGYEIFFDGQSISFKPIGTGKGKATGKSGTGPSSLGMVLGGQGGKLLLTLNNKTRTLGGPAGVSGWAGGPTTEPPLGPNDRVNTTDVPEEIEARPDKTRAQRRALLRRMNPGFTNAQIEAQLIRDDKARAKMAATQSEPVVLLPEPPTPRTPVKPTPRKVAPKRKAKPKPKRVLIARRRKQKAPKRRKPRPTTTTTTTPEPTYPPTYPTTTNFYPTTYPTPTSYPFATNAPNQPYQQFQPYQQQQHPPQQQQYQQQQNFQSQQQPRQQYQQQQSQQNYNPQQQQQFQSQHRFQPPQQNFQQQPQQQQYQPQQQNFQPPQQQQYPPPQQQQQQYRPPPPQQNNNQRFNGPNRQNRPNRPNRPNRQNRRRGRQQRRNRRPPPVKIVGSEVDHILSLLR